MMMLVGGLKERGHTVEYLTFAGRGAGPALRDLGETVHEASVRLKIDPLGIVRMAQIMRRGGYQVVHTHLSTSSTNGALAARLARIPSVASVHGMSGKLSFVFADRVIAVSEGVKKHLIGQGMRAEKIDVVYNGAEFPCVPLDEVARLRVSLGFEDAFPVIGTVARVTPQKGIEYALEAFKLVLEKFPKAAYLVLGDGDGLEACKAKATELGVADSVKFVGYQSPTEPYLALMDLLAFPSLKEAMGIALVEALGQGVAVVSTDVGGIPEVVSPEVGLLVPARDGKAMGEGLIRLAGDDDLRKTMSAAARERARSVFGKATMVEATEAVYQGLLKARR